MKQATAKLQTVMAGSTEETMVAFVTDPGVAGDNRQGRDGAQLV